VLKTQRRIRMFRDVRFSTYLKEQLTYVLIAGHSVFRRPGYSLSNSRVVFSVTLGGWANSFVLTCCRPTGMGMLAAGGNEARAEAEPKVDV
jgi:hypothetical protein